MAKNVNRDSVKRKAVYLQAMYGIASVVVACSSSEPGAKPQDGGSASASTMGTSESAPTASVSPSSIASSLPSVNPSSTSPTESSSSRPSTSTTGNGEQSDTSASETTTSDETATQGSSDGETQPRGDGCSPSDWPSVDPSMPGEFETVTETNVGPPAGEGEDGGTVAFTVFRPNDLAQSGRCHPVITWGNGTGSNPSLYKVLLNHLASHGFIVVASDSPNVAQGDPPPMVAGVTWLLEENEDPESPYFNRVDTAHVGATGHSQGGFATTQAGGDEHITTIAPLCGASPQRNLHGPALLLCGGADDVVDCEGIGNALDAIDQPAMLAKYITADHANWITFRGTTLSPMEVATTAWMRVHLMNDVELRSWFYGPSCALCTDPAWEITQKMMDE